MKRPSFQWYPGDWLKDSNLRLCSLAARGLWTEILNRAHFGEPYGYLTVEGEVIHPVNLAVLVGSTVEEVEGCLEELEKWKVFSRDERGAIYSRRMVRDEAERERRATAGKLGGNPKLLKKRNGGKDKQVVNLVVNQEDNHPVNQKQTPSSSSSSSSSSYKEPRRSKTREMPERAIELAKLLLDSIVSHKPDHRYAEESDRKIEARVHSWAEDIEKMNRLDKRSWDRIGDVIAWATCHHFWAPNIQSGAKLRKQFDTLEAQKLQEARGGAKGSTGAVRPMTSKEAAMAEIECREAGWQTIDEPPEGYDDELPF